MKGVYSTAELAHMLEVNESTVKRWADQGHIECIKTKGGHRRFPIRSVLRFVHENKMTVSEIDTGLLSDRKLRSEVVAGNVQALIPELTAALTCGNTHEVLRILRLGVAAKADLLKVYHELLFPPLVRIGDSWARGETTVDVEHLASQSARDALARMQEELYHKPSNGRTALLACYADEQHDLGLRCINQYLTCEGWRTLFLGPQTPVDSLVFSINRNKPDLICVSMLAIHDNAIVMRDVNREIVPAARRVGARVALGGAQMSARYSGTLEVDYLSDSILDYAAIADLRNYAHR